MIFNSFRLKIAVLSGLITGLLLVVTGVVASRFVPSNQKYRKLVSSPS